MSFSLNRKKHDMMQWVSVALNSCRGHPLAQTLFGLLEVGRGYYRARGHEKFGLAEKNASRNRFAWISSVRDNGSYRRPYVQPYPQRYGVK